MSSISLFEIILISYVSFANNFGGNQSTKWGQEYMNFENPDSCLKCGILLGLIRKFSLFLKEVRSKFHRPEACLLLPFLPHK